MPLSFGDSSSDVHVGFYALMVLLPARVFLQPAVLIALDRVSDLHRLYS